MEKKKIKNSRFWKMKKIAGYIIILHMYQKSQSYEVWFLRYGVRHRFFFLVLERFLSFYPPSNLKNKNFEKKKKTLGDILILHRCAINDNHLMYGSWDIKCDGHKFLSFWTVFCPFTTLRAQKIKSKKKKKNEKNTCRYHHFTHVYQK